MLVSIIGAEHYAADRFLTILFVVASKHNTAEHYDSRTFLLFFFFFKPSAVRNINMYGQQCFELYLLVDCSLLFFCI